MLMPPFELHHPTTVEEAVAAAAALMEKGEAFDWVAGGTDAVSYTHLTLPTIAVV